MATDTKSYVSTNSNIVLDDKVHLIGEPVNLTEKQVATFRKHGIVLQDDLTEDHIAAVKENMGVPSGDAADDAKAQILADAREATGTTATKPSAKKPDPPKGTDPK